jgi:hypothetical protein
MEGNTMRKSQTRSGNDSSLIAAILTAGFVGAASLVSPVPAFAQSQWIDREDVVEKLGAEYAEQPTSIGVARNGGVIELFTARDGATWTMILTMPDGTSRLITAGENWIKMPVQVADGDSRLD